MSQGWGWGSAAGDVSHGGVGGCDSAFPGALPGGQAEGSGAGRGLPGQDWEFPWIGESSRHPNLPQKGKATFPRKRVRHAVLPGGLGRSLAGKSPAALRVEPKGGVTRGTLLLVPQDTRAGVLTTPGWLLFHGESPGTGQPSLHTILTTESTTGVGRITQ